MSRKYYGRERVCASLIDKRIKGKTLNIGAGQMQWIENDLFPGNPNFISSDLNKNNLGSNNLAKNKIMLDAEKKMSFKKGELSQVIILDVLEHLKNHEFTLSEISRVLKKNGKIVICVPNDTLLSYLNPIRYAQHERHYTIKEIVNLLKKNGFKINRVFAGGGIFELIHLYLHLIIKYTTGRLIEPAFLNKLRDKEYGSHWKNGNEIAIKAIKI